MDRTAIEAIAELAKLKEYDSPQGVKFFNDQMRPVVSMPYVREGEHIKVKTLTGLAQYVTSINKIQVESVALTVHDCDMVLFQALETKENGCRNIYGVAKAESQVLVGDLDDWRTVEETIIFLKRTFVSDEELDQLVAMVGKIQANAELRVDDDGIGQKVETKNGVSLSSVSSMKQFVTLKARVSFPEIAPVDLNIFIRIRKRHDEIQIGTFVVSDNSWMLQCQERVRTFLENMLTELSVEDVPVF